MGLAVLGHIALKDASGQRGADLEPCCRTGVRAPGEALVCGPHARGAGSRLPAGLPLASQLGCPGSQCPFQDRLGPGLCLQSLPSLRQSSPAVRRSSEAQLQNTNRGIYSVLSGDTNHPAVETTHGPSPTPGCPGLPATLCLFCRRRSVPTSGISVGGPLCSSCPRHATVTLEIHWDMSPCALCSFFPGLAAVSALPALITSVLQSGGSHQVSGTGPARASCRHHASSAGPPPPEWRRVAGNALC